MIDQTPCAIAVLDRIGVNVRTPKTVIQILTILGALDALHRIGVIHGDPRLPNLLVVDGSLTWIDLRRANARASPVLRRLDWIELIRSIVKSMIRRTLPSGIDSLCNLVCVPTCSDLLDEEVTTNPKNLRALAYAIDVAARQAGTT